MKVWQALFFFIFFLALARAGLAATPITDCTDITSPGEYYLANDIYTSSGDCIKIISSDVVLDGMGHKIYSSGVETGVYAIWLWDSLNRSNITIFNLSIENVDTGIYLKAQLYSITNAKIYNVTIKNCTHAISFYNKYLSFVEIYDSYLEGRRNGIYTYGADDINPSHDVTVHDCEIHAPTAVRLVGTNYTFYRNIINGSIALSDTYDGVPLVLAMFYDNKMNSTIVNESVIYDNTIYFNTTKQVGTNIVGGPYIGGNYWIGYSESCTDSNKDGICDSPYTVSAEFGMIDYLPLTKFTPPQNPDWCDNLGTTILFNYRDSAIYITFNEGNPNVTSVNVNFAVDGVWNNQTGLWNWGTIYDTGILNFYDGNTHTFDFEIVFLNDSTPVCEYSGNFTINPYNETAILTDTWFNETHGGFSVDNRGLEYNWQITIWNETDYVETVFGGPTANSSVTYSHTNLENQKGNYDTQADRPIGYFSGVQVIMRDHLYEQYDFTVFQNPDWCLYVAPSFIITYTGSYGYSGRIDLYHHTNENTTGGTYNYTFYVDSVGVSGSGSLDDNWKYNIFNTSLLDYYDGNTHIFNYTVDYFSSNGSTLCTFSGSITLNPYYETPVVIEDLVIDTPSSISFSVDKRNVSAYDWQLFVFDKNWNSLYYFYNFTEERSNITQTVDLDGKSGYYVVQTDNRYMLSDGTQFFLRDNSDLKEFDYSYAITSCKDITSPGTYYLANDIDASGYDVCISIQSDNVVLNGMGYKIYFPVNTTNKVAIGSGWQTNVTVKNLTVEYGEIAINGYNNTYEDIDLYYGRIWTNSNSNNIILRNINFYEHPANGYENLDIKDGAYNINIENIYFNVTPATFPVMFVRSGSHDVYIKNLTAVGDGINLDQNSIYNVVLDEYTFNWVNGSCLPIYGGANGLVIKNSWIESGDGGDTEIFDSNNTIIENTNFIGGTNLNIKRCENITLKNLYVDNSIVFREWAKNVKVLNNWINTGLEFREGWFENLDIESNEAGYLAFSITSNYVKNSYVYNNSFTWIQISFAQNSTVCNNNADAYLFYDLIFQGWNDYYHERTKGVYVGKECKHVEDGILVEDVSARLEAGNVSVEARNSIIPYVFLYGSANVSIEGNPTIEINNHDIGTLKHILGPISIHTLFNTSIDVNRTVSTYTISKVEFVDNTSGPAILSYYVCGLKPNFKYKLYIDGELNKTFTTDPNGCTPEFALEYHSPHKITIETTYKSLKESLGIWYGVLVILIVLGALAWGLSLLKREISAKALISAALILIAALLIVSML